MKPSQGVLESGSQKQGHTTRGGKTSARKTARSREERAGLALAIALAFAAPLSLGCGMEPDGTAGDGDVSSSAGALSVASGVNVGAVLQDPTVFFLISDLKPDGSMRFYDAGAGQIGVQINVTNIGNAPAWGPAGTVDLDGVQVNSVLYQYYGGTATMGNTVNPGERGYIIVKLPVGALSPCQKVNVNIDVGHNMQAGLPDPFANDTAAISTQCLAWGSKISSNNFPISGAPLEGNSIYRIVSSFSVGRTDGLKCSHCHFQGSGRAYSPPVAVGGSAAITPEQVIGGLTWAQSGGWAERFTHQPTDSSLGSKPFNLKLLIQTWIDHGRRPGNLLHQELLGSINDAVFTLRP